MELATAVGARLHDFFVGEAVPEERLALTDVPALIHSHLARHGTSIEEFEEEVGWDIREFLNSPIKVAAESPIVFLQALSQRLGINWLSFVPSE
jgi:hypothetical protein